MNKVDENDGGRSADAAVKTVYRCAMIAAAGCTCSTGSNQGSERYCRRRCSRFYHFH